MKIKVKLDENGYIDSYCEIGELKDSIEVELVATSYEHFIKNFNFYKIVKKKLAFDNKQYDKIIAYENMISRIEFLKEQLKESDYKIIKHLEGVIEEKEYLLIKEERQKWRDEIKKLEVLING